jgi:hypothetical protein
MFALFWRGLNLGGTLSQVFLPMTTTFVFPSGAAVVTFAKYDISLGSFHGRWPPFPIPLVEVAATMMVSRDMLITARWIDRDQSASTYIGELKSFLKKSAFVDYPDAYSAHFFHSLP